MSVYMSSEFMSRPSTSKMHARIGGNLVAILKWWLLLFVCLNNVWIMESHITSLFPIIPAALGEDIKKVFLKKCVVGKFVNASRPK